MALPVQGCCWPMLLERWLLPGWQWRLLEWLAWRALAWQLASRPVLRQQV